MKLNIKLTSVVELFLASSVIGLGLSFSKIYLFHVVLLLLILTISYLSLKKQVRIVHPRTNLHIVYYLMIAWYLIATVWCQEPLYSIMYLFYLFCGVSIVVVIIYYSSTYDSLHRIFKIFAVLFIVELLISLFESLGLFRYPVSPFSDYAHLFGRKMVDIEKNNADILIQQIFNMPTGFRWNPNNLAIVMNVILPFFLFCKRKWLSVGGVIMIGFIVVSASSRGNMFAFAFICFLYFVMNFKKLVFKVVLLSVFIGVVLVGTLSKEKKQDVIDTTSGVVEALNVYLFEDNSFEETSLGLRQRYIKNGIKALEGTYYIGVGGGNSGNYEYQKNALDPGTKRVSMHNFWIEILVEGGLFIFLIYISWLSYLILLLRKVYRNSHDINLVYFSSSAALSLCGFFIGAVSGSSVIYDFPMWILIGFSIAVVNEYYKQTYENINTRRC